MSSFACIAASAPRPEGHRGLAALAAAVLWMGVYPKPFTDVMDPSIAQLLKHVAASKL